ncbi:MAG: ATP-binding protein [Thermodesulfobacteriota bacterium]
MHPFLIPSRFSLSRGRLGIRFYLVATYLLLLCLLFPLASFLFLGEAAEFRDVQMERVLGQMRRALEERGGALARNLALSAGQAMAGYDFTFLNVLLGEVVDRNSEIVYCLIVDSSGRVIGHNDAAMIGTELDDPQTQSAIALVGGRFPETLDAGRPDAIEFQISEPAAAGQSAPVMEMVVPVYSGLRLAGLLRCGYSLAGLQAENEAIRADWAGKMTQFRYSILSLSGFFFVLGMAIVLFFTGRFEKATKTLSDGVQRIAEGDLSHAIAANDLFFRELSDYGLAFNQMTARLRESLRQLEEYSRSLEAKVEERTRALKEAQEEMLQRAHEAGMAEMAVGVLHNIGNAITPAKVGATLLLRRLQESTLRNRLDTTMEKIAGELLQTETLSREDCRRLGEVARLLPGSIREEYDRMAQEVQKIRDKHEHIENIVALQMRYARLIGEADEIQVNRVIDDALEILDDSLANRGITVVRREGEVPPVRFEQAKMIQIVINLIKNAYEAMQETDGEKVLTISTEHVIKPDNEVIISIRDTGIGFAPEAREKLFRFGYTTKQAGSGFGLHSCANFITANRGRLVAHSDGVGKGAVFTVHLPV